MDFLRRLFGQRTEKADNKIEPILSEHVERIDNSSTYDNWIHNATDMLITVACKQPQAGMFAINLPPDKAEAVASWIQANPYPYGKQNYDEFMYDLGSSESWEVYMDSGKLVMRKVK
jgi:hypothetical protein